MKSLLGLVLLLGLTFGSGCAFPLGYQTSQAQTKSSSDLQQSTSKRVETEYAPPKIHIELREGSTITGGGLTDVVAGAIANSSKSCKNEEHNKLNINVKDKAALDQEASEESSVTKRESILITALGALLLLVVVIVGVSWFKKTAIGQATSAAVSVGTNVIKRQMQALDDQLATETNQKKINDLLAQKARLAQNEIDYLSKK